MCMAKTPARSRIESGILPPPVCREVVEHYCQNEWAVHLDDVMIRRTSWHYYLDNPLETAQQVAAWMAEICAWDAQRQESELTRYRRQVEIDTACRNTNVDGTRRVPNPHTACADYNDTIRTRSVRTTMFFPHPRGR